MNGKVCRCISLTHTQTNAEPRASEIETIACSEEMIVQPIRLLSNLPPPIVVMADVTETNKENFDSILSRLTCSLNSLCARQANLSLVQRSMFAPSPQSAVLICLIKMFERWSFIFSGFSGGTVLDFKQLLQFVGLSASIRMSESHKLPRDKCIGKVQPRETSLCGAPLISAYAHPVL